MREVKVTCPQCKRSYAYFEPEEFDLTGGYYHTTWKQICPYCGYPDVIYEVEYPQFG